jgi:valyl-tRNA synthetase
LSLDGILDVELQTEKINKEIQNLKNYISGLDKKLSNHNFLKKASAEIVKTEKQKHTEAKERLEKLQKLI